MSLSNKELLARAEDVIDALTDAYGAKNKQINKMVLGGLNSLASGLADLVLNGLKAQTPLLALYQLYQANMRPAPKLAAEELNLQPQLRNQALPRPRPY